MTTAKSRAVPEGRHRGTLGFEGTCAALFAALLVAGWSCPVLAEPEYDFSLIEAFDPNYDLREVILRDINESGYVSGTATHDGFYDGFVWTEATGKMILPMVWPQGINNGNQIVSGGQIHDFDTGQSLFAPPTGGWPIPSLQAINDAGIAVGYSECSCSNSGRTLQSAMVWDALNGSRTIPVAAAKELLRINNANSAVGNIRGGSAGSEGFFYGIDTGSYVNMTDLLPPYLFGRAWSELQDLNENDVVCGRGWDGENVRGLTWDSENGFTFLPAIPGGLVERVYPRGINSLGTVVGFADLTAHDPRAFVWDQRHGMRNLNDLVVAPLDFILDWAVKINDQGWIVGIGHYGPGWGTSRGFVLRPNANVATSVDDGAAVRGAFDMRLLANPISDRLDLRFSIPSAGVTRLRVFDTTGRRVADLLDGELPQGVHTVTWNPPSSHPSGVYFVRLDAEGRAASARFVLVR